MPAGGAASTGTPNIMSSKSWAPGRAGSAKRRTANQARTFLEQLFMIVTVQQTGRGNTSPGHVPPQFAGKTKGAPEGPLVNNSAFLPETQQELLHLQVV